MTKRFKRAEVNKIIHDVSVHYYRMYSEDMSLSEKLLFKDIHETIENMVDYKLEKLEKSDDEDD